eukprot:m.1116884 g.1116884  ORF g.1116884 m.1116884 type:complete len:448 (-) comp24380_c0_seq5:4600-5943(-)
MTLFKRTQTAVEELEKRLTQAEETVSDAKLDYEGAKHALATATAITTEYEELARTKEKLVAKAQVEKPKRLINDETAAAYLEFAKSFDQLHERVAAAVVKATEVVSGAEKAKAAAEKIQAELNRQEQERAEKRAAEAQHREFSRAAAADAAMRRASPSTSTGVTAAQVSTTAMDTDTPDQDPGTTPAMDTSPQEGGSETQATTPEDAELQAALAMSMDTSLEEEASANTITVSVKWIANGKDHAITCFESQSVGDLRKLIADVVGGGVTASQITLICAGKRLDSDAVLVAAAGIADGSKLFAAKNPAKSAASVGSSSAAETSKGPSASHPLPTTTTKQALVERIVGAITAMKNATDHSSLVLGVRTLVRLMDNLLKFPGNTRYSRVKMKNPILKDRLLGKPGGVDALKAVGFTSTQENGEDFLVCNSPHADLEAVKQMLDVALSTLQ